MRGMTTGGTNARTAYIFLSIVGKRLITSYDENQMSCKFSDGLSIKPDYTIEAVCTTDDAKHMINKIKNIKYGR